MRTGDGARLRAEKFRQLRAKSWYQGLLVLLPCAALVYFAYERNTPLAIGVPLFLIALILGVGYTWAEQAARQEVMQRFAAARGLAFLGDVDPPAYTPLLRAGDEQSMSCAMEGDGVLLGHFTYTEIRTTTDSDGHTRTEREHHHFTVATTDVEPAMTALPSFYLKPKGFLDFGDGWLSTGNMDRCETESVRFNERFKAWHREGQDAMVLRRFLDPSTVDALANHPLAFGAEISAGQLLVYVKDHLADSGELQGLLDLLERLRAALFAAARVEVSAPARASHGPPAA